MYVTHNLCGEYIVKEDAWNFYSLSSSSAESFWS